MIPAIPDRLLRALTCSVPLRLCDQRARRLDGSSQLLDLPCDAAFEVRALAQRQKLYPAFQRQDMLDGFVHTAPQRSAAAGGLQDGLERFLSERRGLRKKQQPFDEEPFSASG